MAGHASNLVQYFTLSLLIAFSHTLNRKVVIPRFASCGRTNAFIYVVAMYGLPIRSMRVYGRLNLKYLLAVGVAVFLRALTKVEVTDGMTHINGVYFMDNCQVPYLCNCSSSFSSRAC